MKDKTITQVDIRKIDSSDTGSIVEIAKYGAKDADYLKSQEIFDVFYKSLKGKQLITYADIFKDAVKMYENGDLDDYKNIDNNEYVWQLFYEWINNNYSMIKSRRIDEDIVDVKGTRYIEEMEVD